MSAPKVGDRIRITRVVEGTVKALESGADHGTRALLHDCPPFQGMTYGWVRYGGPDETVEMLTPVWQPGDVVRDATGNVWMRDDQDEWYGVRDGGDGDRVAPLTLLVRDGKAVV